MRFEIASSFIFALLSARAVSVIAVPLAEGTLYDPLILWRPLIEIYPICFGIVGSLVGDVTSAPSLDEIAKRSSCAVTCGYEEPNGQEGELEDGDLAGIAYCICPIKPLSGEVDVI